MSWRNGFISRLDSVDDVVAVEADRAAGRLVEPGDHPAGRRLAAAGLADQTERAAGRHLERDPVDGLDVADRAPDDAAGLDREVHPQVLDLEDRRPGRVELGRRVRLEDARLDLLDHVTGDRGDLVRVVGRVQCGARLGLAGAGRGVAHRGASPSWSGRTARPPARGRSRAAPRSRRSCRGRPGGTASGGWRRAAGQQRGQLGGAEVARHLVPCACSAGGTRSRSAG